MKSIIPDPDQLDQLAAGLDAGWDDEPAQASPSQPPHSTPLPESLDALDADWDEAARSPAAAPQPRAAQSRPNQVRPSPTRPSPTRAVTPPKVNGAAPLRATKQERREAERKRRAHEAQQKSANKKERKAERQAAARLASEQQRAAEQAAEVERRARQKAARPRVQRVKPRAEAEDGARAEPRNVKRTRREPVRAAPSVVAVKREAPPIPAERTLTKLVPIVVIALVLAVSLGFALSRAR